MNKINGLVLSALTATFLVGCGGGGGSGSSSTTETTSTEITQFKLTNSMISGKEIHIEEYDGFLQFKADGTYYETSDDGSCTGTWVLNSNGTVTSNQVCIDSEGGSDVDVVIYTFLSEPKAGSKLSFNVDNGSDIGEVTILKVSDIVSTTTDVTVERGALLGATVKDANEQKATAKSSNSNVYVFATTPVYPITATGGYIDVDANGTITTTDVAFTGVLKSYSTVITPITTYVATGITQEDRATKLMELKGKIGGTVSDDDLLKKVPSETSIDIVVLTNAIYDSYSVLFDTDTTNDDVSSLSTIFTDKIALYKNVVTQSGSGKTIKELATLVEEELIINKGIPNLTDSEVAKINGITNTPTNSSSSFILTNSMISGKEIHIEEYDGFLQFKADGTYYETSDDGSCTGTWVLNSNGTVTSNQVCIDSEGGSDVDVVIYTFLSEPKAGSKLSFNVDNGSDIGEVTITSISSIESK